MEKKIDLIDKAIVYPGFFRLEKYWLKHSLYAGGLSPKISRECLIRNDCVAVLLYDPITDEIVMIEQFRIGAMVHGKNAWLVEIVAGGIEQGEDAISVAHREAFEEAGCVIQELFEIASFYTSPGCSAEWLTLFCGKVDSRQVAGVHGLKEEHEDILVHTIPLERAYQMLVNGEIMSAIPIIALQWLMLNKEQVKKRWIHS